MDAVTQPLSLRDLLIVLQRQRIGIFLIVLASVAMGLLTIGFTNKVWRSQTQVFVEGRSLPSDMVNPNDPITRATLPNQDLDIPSHIEVLQSVKLLETAYEESGLPMPNQNNLEAFGRPTITVDQVGTTKALVINVESEDPEVAVGLARSLPKAYLNFLQASRRREVTEALGFLTDRLKSETTDLATAENKLEDFLKKRKLTPLDAEMAQRSQLVTNSRNGLIQTEADVVAATERLDDLIKSRAQLPDVLKNTATQPNLNAIQSLESEIAQMKAKRAGLLNTYLPTAVEVKDLDSQIAIQEARLKKMPKTVDASSVGVHPQILNLDSRITEARAELESAKARRNRYVAWAQENEENLKEYLKIQPVQTLLERDVTDRKTTIASIKNDLEQLRARTKAVKDPISVLAPATMATLAKPLKAQTMILFVVFGVFVALVFAFVKESVDDKVYSSEEVLALSEAPVLGEAPALPRSSTGLLRAGEKTQSADKYRMLGLNLLYPADGSVIRSVQITSSGPAEGKTAVSVNLAIAAAKEGKTVILVDANFKNPTLHKVFGLTLQVGVLDKIFAGESAEGFLRDTKYEGLRVLCLGAEGVDSDASVTTPKLAALSSQLSDLCDLVVMDTSSVINSVSSQLMSHEVDGVVYVAKSGASRRAGIRKGINLLEQAQGRVLGIVMTGAKASTSGVSE